jgi:flagellar motility protein MotE (MotC chaperone)
MPARNDVDLRSAVPMHSDAFKIVPKAQNGNVVLSDEAGSNKEVIKAISDQIKAQLSKIDDEKTKLLEQMASELNEIAAIQAAKEEDMKKRIEQEKANPESRTRVNEGVDTSKSGSALLTEIMKSMDSDDDNKT